MSIAWTIQFGNEPALTLADAGIKNVVRRILAESADSADLEYREANVFRALPFRFDSTVKIKRDGVIWFAGKLNQSSRDERSLTVTVYNAWHDLERTIYLRAISFVDDAAITLASDTLADFPSVPKTSSVILLNRDDANAKIDTKAQIILLLNYAIAKGIALQIGTVEDGVQIPAQELRDVSLAEAIRECLRWTPDLTPWFDYSLTPPKIHVTKRRGKTALTLDTQTTVFEPGMRFTAKPDLVIDGVTLNFLRVHERPSFQFKTLSLDIAGTPERGRQLVRTFELYGSRYSNLGSPAVLTKINDAEAVPSGIAARILESLDDLQYEGSANIVADDCPAGSYLNRTLNVTHFTPECAAMAADIRGQDDDVQNGRTTIHVGPPASLGAGDYVELLRSGKPADLTPVAQQTTSPYGPQPNALPTTTPRNLRFPNPPRYTVTKYSFYVASYSSGGGGVTVSYSDPSLTFKYLDGTVAGVVTADSISVVGAVGTFYGVTVGRTDDVDLGYFPLVNNSYSGPGDYTPYSGDNPDGAGGFTRDVSATLGQPPNTTVLHYVASPATRASSQIVQLTFNP